MTKVTRIGIIAEDATDYEAIKAILLKLTKNAHIGYKKRVGDGCGRIASKCLAWSNELHAQRCNVLILIQDRDRNNAQDLKSTLEGKLQTSKIKTKLVCIPVEELEAWLIADPDTLKTMFSLKYKPKFRGMPENIESPKEKLRDELYRCSDSKIIHLPKNNITIAGAINLDIVKSKCPSFRELTDFVGSLVF